MASFVLYNAPQSTCSQRVRFVMHAKGLPFEEHKLDLMRGDQLDPSYLAFNPNGVVPTLLHDGKIVIDSSVIIEYLDEVFEPAQFTPRDPVARAAMRSLMRFIDEVPAAAVRVPTYNLAFLPHFQAMSEEEFLAMANSKPLRKEFLLSMGRTGFPEKEMQVSMERMAKTVARMDQAIAASGGPFLMGSQLTLADISLMPAIVRVDDLNLSSRLWGSSPAVAAWLSAIKARPEFRKTYYHGSLLTEKYPHLREKLAAAS